MVRLHSMHAYPILEFKFHWATETKTNGVGTSLGAEGAGLRKIKESRGVDSVLNGRTEVSTRRMFEAKSMVYGIVYSR